MSEERVVLKDVALNVWVGSTDRPNLVLFHGVTRRWDDWLVLIPYLQTRWKVHAVDQRGHGKSGRVPHAYRVVDFVTDAVEYVASLDGPAMLFGHSLGAMVSCGVAAQLPEKIHGLILEDPTFEMTGRRISETLFPDTFHAYLPLIGSDLPPTEVARRLALAQVRAPGVADKVPLGSVRDLASLRYTATCLRLLDPTILPLILEGRWLEDYDVVSTLEGIECPTLFLQGDIESGGALDDGYAQELAGHIDDCVHVKLPRTGHNIHSTQTELLLRPVLPFLASLG